MEGGDGGPRDGVPPEVARSRRLRHVRASTLSPRRITKRELLVGRALYPEVNSIERPRSRGECAAVKRPCPFVGCRHHLYLDVSPRTGSIKFNFPDLEPEDMPPGESCSLDVADAGRQTLQRTGDVMNITRERTRQLEQKAYAHFVEELSPAVRDELLDALERGREP